MSKPLPPLEQVWQRAVSSCEAYADTNAGAAFSVNLLRQLRGQWESSVRVTTSHWDLIFTRPAEHPYPMASEEVLVRLILDDRVEVSLRRSAPRRGETRPVGPVTVAGDFTRPQNALPAVEALLLQLAEPEEG